MKLINSVICLGFFAGLIGCGAKSPQDVKQEAQNMANAGGNAAVDKATYASSCVSSTIPDIGAIKFPGTKTIYELSPITFAKIQVYDTDGDCNSEGFIVRETGKVVVQGQSKSLPGALEEDFNFEKTTVKVQSDTLLKAFNLLKICGFSDWVLGVERDVSTEAAQGTCPGKPSPRTAQELVLINNGSLLLGGDTDQAVRPAAVDSSKVYIKQ